MKTIVSSVLKVKASLNFEKVKNYFFTFIRDKHEEES